MKKLSQSYLYAVVFLFMLCACNNAPKDTSTSLFNGEDLTGWDVFIGPLEKGGEAVGLNKDTFNIFSVVELEGENVIKISGEINASLATKEEYDNYHLSMEFKWGEKLFTKWNSGLLYHSYGEFGQGLDVWMSSHELQLYTAHIGDSYRMGYSYCDIPMVKGDDDKYTYQKGQSPTASIPKTETQIIAKDADYEKTAGEWNTIELYCFGRTSVHVVNGKVNMINYNSGKYLEDESVEVLTKGKIQLQSEGGELFVRNIKIQPIEEIPVKLME